MGLFNKIFASTDDDTNSEIRDWPIWKTIKLGVGPQTAEDLHEELKTNGVKIGNWAEDILGGSSFPVAGAESEIDLVVLPMTELGFNFEDEDASERITYEQVYKRARELGLDLLPAEVGPRLRLEYKDQPENEWILIATEPIKASDGMPLVFSVGRDDSSLRLVNFYQPPSFHFSSDCLWAFSRRK